MWCHLIRIEFKKAMSLEQMMISKQNKRHSYLFKLEFLSWHSHVRGDRHFKSLDYPHSHVSVMFYTRFSTCGYAKHRCKLLWITRSSLIILKCCCKLLLRLSHWSWGTHSIIHTHKPWIALAFMQSPILSAMLGIVWDAIRKIETPLFLSKINWINVFSTSQSNKMLFCTNVYV